MQWLHLLPTESEFLGVEANIAPQVILMCNLSWKTLYLESRNKGFCFVLWLIYHKDSEYSDRSLSEVISDQNNWTQYLLKERILRQVKKISLFKVS